MLPEFGLHEVRGPIDPPPPLVSNVGNFFSGEILVSFYKTMWKVSILFNY